MKRRGLDVWEVMRMILGVLAHECCRIYMSLKGLLKACIGKSMALLKEVRKKEKF